MADIKTKNDNGLIYKELAGYKLGDVFEYKSERGIIRHYVISFIHKRMGLPIITILFPDGFSDITNIECIKYDRFIKNIDWWKIHDEYIEEANMYL